MSVYFESVVSSPDFLHGIKSIKDVSQEPVFCFNRTDADYASKAARKGRPWVLTLGHSKNSTKAHRSRVLELVSMQGPAMPTEYAINDAGLRAEWERLDTTILATEVYTISGFPHAKRDLGVVDLRKIMRSPGAHVNVNPTIIYEMWNQLRHCEVTLRADLTHLVADATARYPGHW